jgi:hypothetical protein
MNRNNHILNLDVTATNGYQLLTIASIIIITLYYHILSRIFIIQLS